VEKNTLLAVALSMIVIVAFFVMQSVFFPPRPAQNAPIQAETPSTAKPAGNDALIQQPSQIVGATPEEGEKEERVFIDNGLVAVTLSNEGGDIVSYKLKEHKDKDGFVEMVLPAKKESHAFTIAFGNVNTEPITSFFKVKKVSDYIVEFSRDFLTSNGANRFRLIKRYEFRPKEYMFELTVTLEGDPQGGGFNFEGVSYNLGFGPQIGPAFTKLDQRYEYRRYYTYTNGKRKEEKVTENAPAVIGNRLSWAGVVGKYFALLAIPYPTQYHIVFSAKPEDGLSLASRLFIVRPALNSSRTEDKYQFYMGPKTQDALAAYNNGKNSFNLTDMELIKVADSSGVLAPLETALKWFLMLFYKVIPNYGVAIILLTLLVKAVLFPLTRKSSAATLRMQALSPKIKELQEKYKGNPQKLNEEMAKFYKAEGYNPMSGCLPMLIQIPIFLAMYNLFNNHFDLRGAMFIPGWIPDLSLPEAVFTFPHSFILPILGWNAIRALPFIYVGSQLLYGKVTQTPGQGSNMQMKFMLYAMPIIFFFILYDVPSGLLIYWIMSNILTLVQQLVINKYLAPQRAALAEQSAEPLKLPPKKKKKR
jgi:YidC/Oxa1 family membrane protein insertase